MFIGREYYLERLEALWRKSVASLVVNMHLTGSDECDPSISGSDQGGCKSDSDECSFFGLADACTWGLNKDIAE